MQLAELHRHELGRWAVGRPEGAAERLSPGLHQRRGHLRRAAQALDGVAGLAVAAERVEPPGVAGLAVAAERVEPPVAIRPLNA